MKRRSDANLSPSKSKKKANENIYAIKRIIVRNDDDPHIYLNFPTEFAKIGNYVYKVGKNDASWQEMDDGEPEGHIGLTKAQYDDLTSYIFGKKIMVSNFNGVVNYASNVKMTLHNDSSFKVIVNKDELITYIIGMLDTHIISVDQTFNVNINGTRLYATVDEVDENIMGIITSDTKIDFDFTENIIIYDKCVNVDSKNVKVTIDGCVLLKLNVPMQTMSEINGNNITKFPILIDKHIVDKYVRDAIGETFTDNTNITYAHGSYEFTFSVRIVGLNKQTKYRNTYKIKDNDVLDVRSNTMNVIITEGLKSATKVSFSCQEIVTHKYDTKDYLLPVNELTNFVRDNIKIFTTKQTFKYTMPNKKEINLKINFVDPRSIETIRYRIEPTTKINFSNDNNTKFVLVKENTPSEIKKITFKVKKMASSLGGIFSLFGIGGDEDEKQQLIDAKKLEKDVKNLFPKRTAIKHRMKIEHKTMDIMVVVKEIEFKDETKNSKETNKKKEKYHTLGLITANTEFKFITPKKEKSLTINAVSKDVDNPVGELEKYVGGLNKEIKKMVRTLCLARGKLRDEFLARGLKPVKGIIFHGPPGCGKCLHPETPVLMYDGSIKMAKDVQTGDQLMGDDSTPRNVLSTCNGQENMYRVKQTYGDDYIVNESHILSLVSSRKPRIKYEKDRCRIVWWENGKEKSISLSIQNNGTKDQQHYVNSKVLSSALDILENMDDQKEIIDISVRDYLQKPNNFKNNYKGFKVGVEFEHNDVPFDPYLLGVWLGDGTAKDPEITNTDKPILDKIENIVNSMGLEFNQQGKDIRYYISGKKLSNGNIFLNYLREYNLINNKHIPDIYKCNDRETRLKVLAGLIDTDGYYYSNSYEIAQKSDKLANDIVYLCRSLGFKTTLVKREKTCTNSANGRVTGIYNIIYINGEGLEDIPVVLERKKAKARRQIKDALVYGIELELLGPGNYCGFEIDGNRRFLLGDFTVTHNTRLARNIGKIFGCEGDRCRLMSGPEIFNKWLGQSEKNIREIFKPAKDAWKKHGTAAPLYMVVIDEIDAMLPVRTGSSNSPARDSVVNQFLAEIDGLEEFNNFVCVGLTNKLDLLDPAILRPGRFGTHIKIDLPDKKGRIEIFNIHSKKLKELDRLDNVDFDRLAELTDTFSGADIEAIVELASTYSLERLNELDKIDDKIIATKGKVTHADFVKAINEIKTENKKTDDGKSAMMYI